MKIVIQCSFSGCDLELENSLIEDVQDTDYLHFDFGELRVFLNIRFDKAVDVHFNIVFQISYDAIIWSEDMTFDDTLHLTRFVRISISSIAPLRAFGVTRFLFIGCNSYSPATTDSPPGGIPKLIQLKI